MRRVASSVICDWSLEMAAVREACRVEMVVVSELRSLDSEHEKYGHK